MQIGLFLAIPAGILNFIAVDNLIILAIAFFINGLSSLPITNINGLLVIDCALYNEWQGRPRMEGTLASVVGFAARIGQAFGVFILGILLSATGFDGTLDVQSESATMMIRYIFAFNPVVWSVLAALVLTFFKMDKKKIAYEVEQRREDPT